jgi:hypothetical protein
VAFGRDLGKDLVRSGLEVHFAGDGARPPHLDGTDAADVLGGLCADFLE